MEESTYDEAARFLAKEATESLAHWLLGLGPEEARIDSLRDAAFVFRGQQRICDLLIAFADLSRAGFPCAGIVEFQIRPDPLMFARMLLAGGMVWQQVKPSEESGDRYDLMAVVVNLTGRGNCARESQIGPMRWAVVPREINLEEMDAEAVLLEIESGAAPKEVLAFVPLMKKGGEDAIIDAWLRIARAETDLRKRGIFALATVFAQAVGLKDLWKRRLEGLTMIDTPLVAEWKAAAHAKGVLEGTVEAVLRVLDRRFGVLPAELTAGIRRSEDIVELSRWMDVASVAPTLDDFRRDASV